MKRRLILAVLILGLAFTAAYPGAVQFDFLLSQARYSAGSLAGAKVWIYKAGTTTIDNDVWLDIHKVQKAANPYTLDVNGTALIYGDNTYRVVIRSQPDNVVRIDRDNVYVGDGWTDFVDSNYTTTIRPKSVYGDGSGTVSGYKFGSPAFTDNGSFHDLQGNGGTLDGYTVTGSIINGSQLVDGSVLLVKLAHTGTPDNTTFLRGDGVWDAGTLNKGALVYNTTIQSIDNVTHTPLNFTGEIYDFSTIHSTGVDNTKLTVPAGITAVRITGQVSFYNNAVGARRVTFRKNGGEAFAGNAYFYGPAVTGGFPTTINVTTPILQVSAGDYFEFYVYQSSGGSLQVDSGSNLTWFAMETIR